MGATNDTVRDDALAPRHPQRGQRGLVARQILELPVQRLGAGDRSGERDGQAHEQERDGEDVYRVLDLFHLGRGGVDPDFDATVAEQSA